MTPETEALHFRLAQAAIPIAIAQTPGGLDTLGAGGVGILAWHSGMARPQLVQAEQDRLLPVPPPPGTDWLAVYPASVDWVTTVLKHCGQERMAIELVTAPRTEGELPVVVAAGDAFSLRRMTLQVGEPEAPPADTLPAPAEPPAEG